MECEYYSIRTTYLILEAFQILFPTASLILAEAKLFHQVIRERTKIKRRPLRTYNGGCFETLNLLQVSSCEIFTFCDVLHETKQITETNSRECAVRTGNHFKAESLCASSKNSGVMLEVISQLRSNLHSKQIANCAPNKDQ